MRTIKDGRVRVHVFHGYNEKQGYYYGSHEIVYRKPRYKEGTLGFIYHGEWFPYEGDTSSGDAVIIFDVFGRAQEARRKAEEARREALGPEGRAEEDRKIFSTLVQYAYGAPEVEFLSRVKVCLRGRHCLSDRKLALEHCREAIKMLRFKRAVMKASKEELAKWGVIVEKVEIS